jgi:hypothetical protein
VNSSELLRGAHDACGGLEERESMVEIVESQMSVADALMPTSIIFEGEGVVARLVVGATDEALRGGAGRWVGVVRTASLMWSVSGEGSSLVCSR